MRQSERIKAIEGRRIVAHPESGGDGSDSSARIKKRRKASDSGRRSLPTTAKSARLGGCFGSLPIDIFVQVSSHNTQHYYSRRIARCVALKQIPGQIFICMSGYVLLAALPSSWKLVVSLPRSQISYLAHPHGTQLYCFLYAWDNDDEARQAMDKRREIIEERVDDLDIPWSEYCNAIHYSTFVFWHTLTEQVKPLTEGAWKSMLPIIQLVLELNGQQVEQAVEQPMRRAWAKHVKELLIDAFAQSDPSQLARIASALKVERVASSSDVSNRMRQSMVVPTPNLKDSLKWDFMRPFRWAIHDRNETEELFTPRLNSINARVPQWIQQVERDLTGLLFRGPRNKQIHENVTLTVNGTTTATAHLSNVTRRLLRADCVFRASKEHPLYLSLYGGSDPVVPMPLHYPDLIVTRRDDSWNYTYLQPYPDATQVAKASLGSLEMPDATNLELKLIGCRLVCGQCSDKRTRDWSGMIQHHIEEGRRKKQQRLKSLGAAMLNGHDLTDISDKSLVQIVSVEAAGELPDLSKTIPPLKPLRGERRYHSATRHKSPQQWRYLRTGELVFNGDDGALHRI
ncbi:F-box protein [Ceratobasidium sp. AG-Ba]|nr:F-box protein [Ceratobasidium sp. AG-Ba]